MSICYENGKRGTMLYSRYLMEKQLGRKLGADETVDHIDEDSTNDSIANLQILSRSDNSKKHWVLLGKRTEYVDIICPKCGKEVQKLARDIRGNRKKGKGGPYCGRSCAGKSSIIPSRKTKFVHGTLTAYQYNKCRCDLCRAKNAEVKRFQRISKMSI